jgi:hypothetical protein
MTIRQTTLAAAFALAAIGPAHGGIAGTYPRTPRIARTDGGLDG